MCNKLRYITSNKQKNLKIRVPGRNELRDTVAQSSPVHGQSGITPL